MSVTLHINAEAVKVKHLRELGRLKNFDEIVAWMVAHAGAVEAELDELSLGELVQVQTSIMDELRGAAVPKSSSG